MRIHHRVVSLRAERERQANKSVIEVKHKMLLKPTEKRELRSCANKSGGAIYGTV